MDDESASASAPVGRRKRMTIPCLNCGHDINESGIDSSYREGYEANKPVWILDQAIGCTNCEIVMGRSHSNDAQIATDWDFHRSSNLGIVKELTETEVEEARSKISRYVSMTKELSQLLSRRRATDRTVRYRAAGTTGLAIIRGDGVVGVFATMVDL